MVPMTDELRWSAFTDAELRTVEAALEDLMTARKVEFHFAGAESGPAPADELARTLFRSASDELARRCGGPLRQP